MVQYYAINISFGEYRQFHSESEVKEFVNNKNKYDTSIGRWIYINNYTADFYTYMRYASKIRGYSNRIRRDEFKKEEHRVNQSI